MFNTIIGAGAVGAGAASRYVSVSSSDQKMRLLAAPTPAPQHWMKSYFVATENSSTSREFSLPAKAVTEDLLRSLFILTRNSEIICNFKLQNSFKNFSYHAVSNRWRNRHSFK
jgi:hypothetical protein